MAVSPMILESRAALKTISFLVDAGARVILVSHLGRPKGRTEKLTLRPVSEKLSQLLAAKKTAVSFATDCIGPEAEQPVDALKPGQVCLLENVRFYPEEEKNDPAFAKKLAALADVYVDDAFGTAHRAHASTEGVTKFLRPALAGFLIDQEVRMLGAVPALPNPTICHYHWWRQSLIQDWRSGKSLVARRRYGHRWSHGLQFLEGARAQRRQVAG